MILSNNPRTYIDIALYYKIYETKTYKKYINRWIGPSAVPTFSP